MLTATKDLMLPATVTGSWPRPRWYDGGLWGRPLDSALLDVRFREQFLDAHAIVLAVPMTAHVPAVTARLSSTSEISDLLTSPARYRPQKRRQSVHAPRRSPW